MRQRCLGRVVDTAADGAGGAFGKALRQKPGLCVQKRPLAGVPLRVGSVLRGGCGAVGVLCLSGCVGAALVFGQALGQRGEGGLPAGELLGLSSQGHISGLRVAEGGSFGVQCGKFCIQCGQLGPRLAGFGLFQVGLAAGGGLCAAELVQRVAGVKARSGPLQLGGQSVQCGSIACMAGRIGAGRVIDVIWNKYPRMTELEVRSHLAKLGFRGETVFKPCEALSGGELARLRFAEIVLERPNLLFLDEPTNHLDIYTRENLTEALMAYTGTLLLVTHDRHLMNSLACPILYLEDGKAVIYPSYDALMGRAAPAPVAEKSSEPAKAGYGKEQRRRRAELRAKIKACEDEMEACGAREVELENEINSPEVYNDPQLLREKSDELSDLRFHQDELFAAWEAAVEEQEQYEQTAGGEE